MNVCLILLVCLTASFLAVHGCIDSEAHKIGSQKSPGISCEDILRKRSESSLPNGVYWIKFGNKLKFGSESFPVFCDMKAGGWTMVFKTVAGHPITPIRNWWLNPFVSTETSIAALNTKAVFKGIYKNRIVSNTHWKRFKPQEVRMVFYTRGVVQLLLRFDARQSDYLNWFSLKNLRESPWQDIKTQKINYFTIKGPCWSHKCRDFHINSEYPGCSNDIGWLSLGGFSCPWEKRFPGKSFIFSKKSTRVNYNHHDGVGTAEVFAVYVR